uniref:FBA_2 domain-containing protein n=1 Tax=Caenorhabditis tropicalis TaxID=1561998 RepID=A0A1I7TCN6_9PELO
MHISRADTVTELMLTLVDPRYSQALTLTDARMRGRDGKKRARLFRGRNGNPTIWCDSEYKNLFPLALQHHICHVFNLSTELIIRFARHSISKVPVTQVIDIMMEAKCYETRCAAPKEFYKQLQVRNFLHLNTPSYINPESQIFSVNHILSKTTEWLTRDHLLNFRGVSAVFQNTKSIGADDLIAFVENWMLGSNTKLEVICLNVGQRTRNLHVRDIINRRKLSEKFNAVQWNPEKQGGRFKWPPTFEMKSRTDLLNCTRGMDIERDSDGMLATILIDGAEFRFYVWHERFPDQPTTTGYRDRGEYFVGCKAHWV